MKKFISNGKSKHLIKGKEYEVTEEMYAIFVKAGYVEGETVKKETVKKSK